MKPARIASIAGLAVIATLVPRPAAALARHYLIAIGNNERPESSGRGEEDDVANLRYADDDAASMATFWRELGAETELLTVFDADSQRRFPSLSGTAQPPTLGRLREVVASLRTRFDADRQAGNDPILVVYYSGHGSAKAGEDPSLAMLDGPLTRKILYDEVLAALPARYVHLIIDACHAEAVVRPRDLQAEVAPVADADLEAYAARSTLRRFPHVGAVIATSSVAEAHEWDEYQRGVFTFQVLSALRGAADVNRDGLIEYSELSAFLGSANASVVDPRAKLAVVARPPAVNPRAPIADLSGMRQRAAILTGVGPGLGRFFIEDERGNRLGEIRAETGFRYELFLPSGEQLYVRTPTSEGSFRTEPGVKVAVGSLALTPRSTRTRGAVESSLRHGLFATPFGPTYYRGFVDARADLPPVDLRSEPLEAGPDTAGVQPRWSTLRWAGVTLVAAGVIGVAVGAGYGLEVMSKDNEIDHTCVPGTACSQAEYTKYVNDVADAKTAHERSIIGFSAGAAAVVAGTALFLLARPHSSDSSLSLHPSLGPGGAGAMIGGAW
jgi:hypothetical protein